MLSSARVHKHCMLSGFFARARYGDVSLQIRYRVVVVESSTPKSTYPSRELTGLSHPNILSRLPSALILSTNSARLECSS